MPLTVTPLYAAPLLALFLVLCARIIFYRRANLISLGDKGDKNLLKRMRAQANFVEYTPLALILLVMAELQGAPAVALHLLGAGLLAGRVLHAVGFASTPQKLILRQLGTGFTMLVMALTALAQLGHAMF